MQFKPKTQADIDAENLCTEGDFPFTVLEAVEKTDKKGRGFFAVKLNVHGDEERDYHIYDNLSPAWMAHKLLHFCEGVGLYPQYCEGNLSAADLVGREGHCSVSMEDAQNGYPAKNIVEDYLVKDRKEAMAENKARVTGEIAPAQSEVDQDVPF